MIAFVKGIIIEVEEKYVVIETSSGVGYKVLISPGAEIWEKLKLDEEVELFTSQYFRENDQGLFGFSSPAERNFFELLTTVSGVGPKLASVLLANIEHKSLAQMIMSEDIAGIVKVPGIGKKMAERVIIDLRDKVLGVGDGEPLPERKERSLDVEFLSQALGKLGFSAVEIEHMLEGAAELLDQNESVEDVLRILLGGGSEK